MLKSLRLHNFRTYLNTAVLFTQHHLIIGKNNSGKTNLCAAIKFLRSTATQDLAAAAFEVPGGLTEITNWYTKSTEFEVGFTCEIPVDGDPHSFEYALRIGINDGAQPDTKQLRSIDVRSERLTVTGGGFTNVDLIENDGHEASLRHEKSDEGFCAKTLSPRGATMLSKLYELDTNRRAIAFRRYLTSWVYYSLSPLAMREGWRSGSAHLGAMSQDGRDLASTLFGLKNFDERRYRRVLEHVSVLEPNLEAVNFLPVPDQGPVPFVDMRGKSRASWASLSDGTLRALGLALIAEAAAPGDAESANASSPLTVIEEPENGIYPGYLGYLSDLFEDRAGHAQFIFTSHSPYFINFFDAFRERVTLLRNEEDRTVQLEVPAADDDDEDRQLLAEQYSMELIS